jgi:hypothetical protein
MSQKRSPLASPESYYHELAEKCGFKFVGPVPPNNKTKTTWECDNGHRWQAPAKNIYSGSGCPTCAKAQQREARHTSKPWTNKNEPAPNSRLPEDAYLAAATEAGIHWLGPLPPSSKSLTNWECPKKHQWQAPYTNIAFAKSGCPACAQEKVRNSEQDYRRIGLEHSLAWIGPLPKSVSLKTWWMCPSGHHFEKRLKSIQTGEGCPVCYRLMYKKHANTGPHSLTLCHGQNMQFETLIEAEYEKQYFDKSGCGITCTNNHVIKNSRGRPAGGNPYPSHRSS